jgi:hypothetical protein
MNGVEYKGDEGDVMAKSIVETTAIMADANDKYACPKCKGKVGLGRIRPRTAKCQLSNLQVFEAEKMSTSNGVVFHRNCFTCQDCSRAMDTAAACDGENHGELFCHNCYGKRFGPAVLRVCGANETGGLMNVSRYTKPSIKNTS